MAMITHTVEAGDTLSAIALTYNKKYPGIIAGSTLNARVQALADLNDLPDPDLIIEGETLKIGEWSGSVEPGDSTSSGTTSTTTSSVAKKVAKNTIKIGPQSGDASKMVARWSWTRANTGSYLVRWSYGVPNDTLVYVGVVDEETEQKYHIYSPPSNADRVIFSVKPIATYKTNLIGTKVYEWNDSDWSDEVTYWIKDNPPSKPPKPTVEYKDGKLIMSLDNLDANVDTIVFQIVKDDKEIYKTLPPAKISYNSVTCTYAVPAGSEYKVYCQAFRGNQHSDWSDPSDTVTTAPTSIGDIVVCQANSSNSVYLMWAEVKGADSYEIEHTTKLEYFGGSNETETKTTTQNTFIVTGLDSGMEHFFRVRAVNSAGHTAWSSVKSVVLGTKPDAPTTWSSTTIAVTGEPLYLYWVHNSEDQSRETKAELELDVDGEKTIKTIQNGNFGAGVTSNPHYYISEYDHQSVTIVVPNIASGSYLRFYVRREDSVGEAVFDEVYAVTGRSKTVKISGLMPETAYVCNVGPYTETTGADWWGTLCWSTTYEETENLTGSYKFDTSGYSDGAELRWRVRTAGATGELGDWSIQRQVTINAPATLALRLVDSEGNAMSTLTQFPFTVECEAGPASQDVISFHLSVVANETYETVDITGVEKHIGAGSVIYSKHFDNTEDLNTRMSAYDLDLSNNIEYTVKGVVTMSSGLTAEDYAVFTVAWTEEEYAPTAEIGIDEETYSAIIRPYCFDTTYDLVEGVTLAVYRREYDGTFTEIATGLKNAHATYVVDPHVALDLARYRIVAISDETGAVSYRDASCPSVNKPPIIIQWDETWTSFDIDGTAMSEPHPWSGSMLKLPYNIDISPRYSIDTALVEYAGRKHPVSYFGTQLGETASWNTTIPKSDKETLYALRRLSVWTGNVYVREPSGMGYWAIVSVSYNIKHLDVTVPVTLEITRVEGGM